MEKWFNDWASRTDVYDADDGEGVAYTRTEAEAVNTRSLTQEEPLPQTIYRFKSIIGKPLMVSFQMQVKQKLSIFKGSNLRKKIINNLQIFKFDFIFRSVKR